MSFDHIEIWTDGSISKNPSGAGGIGILLISDRLDLARVIGRYFPEDERNTNNRMELEAVIVGLSAVDGKMLVIKLHSDSMYVLDGIKAGGYVTNKDLWDRYNDILRRNNFYLHPIFIKGHNGTTNNMFVDKLAGNCRINMNSVEDRGSVRDILEKYR